MPAIRMRRASETDIDFMMSAERQPGYAELVGRFTEDEYRAEMAKADSALMIGEDDERARGAGHSAKHHHHFRNIISNVSWWSRRSWYRHGHDAERDGLGFTELKAYRCGSVHMPYSSCAAGL